MKQWINNHTHKTLSGEEKSKLLDLSGKAVWHWQPYQDYFHLYYDKKLHSIITNAYLEYCEGLSDSKEADSLFKICNHELQVMMEDETSEVKAEVKALCEKSVMMKEGAKVEEILTEHFSEQEIKETLWKKSVLK